MKSLSISISGRFIFNPKFVRGSFESHEPKNAALGLDAEDENNYDGLGKLIRLTNRLEDLDYHYYRLWGPFSTHCQRIFQRIAELNPLPKLKRLELRGYGIREKDLLTLLQTGVRKLVTYEIIIDGNIKFIFDHCTDDATDIDEFCFENLHERKGMCIMRVLENPRALHEMVMVPAAATDSRGQVPRSNSRYLTVRCQ